MLWLYALMVLLPPLVIYNVMTKDNENPDTAVVAIVFGGTIAFLQIAMVWAGGWLWMTLAVLVFLFFVLIIVSTLKERIDGLPGPLITAGRISSVPFTEIEFDYLDAKGDRSHRTVEVWAVDDEYFEGHCHKASSTRTFVIGRIRGKVLVHDTGELLSPRQWAAQARQDPLNSAQVQGRPN